MESGGTESVEPDRKIEELLSDGGDGVVTLEVFDDD